MLKVGVWPRLRAIGLSGSGTTIRLPCKDAYAMIGLQRSTSSTRDLVKFTANVSVTTTQRWAEMRMDASFLGEKPSPNSHPWGWGTRIGHLMPDRADTWWTIQTGDCWQPVAEAVLEAIETFALPRMRQELAARL